MSLNETLLIEIEKSLPAMAAGEMKNFINSAEKTAELYEIQTKKLNQLALLLEGKDAEIEYLEKERAKEVRLREREKECEEFEKLLKEKQRVIDVYVLEIKLGMEEKSNEKLMALVDKVFGHPSVSVTTSETSNATRYNSMNSVNESENVSNTKNVKETQSKV